MTAEVAVLNKSGIAVAADSALTTGVPGREKIFTTANKIFTLSKVEPVGIMINGQVEHFGCPWEVIIKDFRSRIGRKKFGDLYEYVSLFVSTIKDQKLVSEDGQKVSVMVASLATLSEIDRRLDNDGSSWKARNIKEVLDAMIAYSDTREIIPEFVDTRYRDFSSEYSGIINDVSISDEFIFKPLPAVCLNTFKKAVFSLMTRKTQTQYNTGIVIFGYGSDNLYPKLTELNVDGGFLGKVRFYESASYDVDNAKDGAHIVTFAQDDVVNAFLNGIDDKLHLFYTAMSEHFMELLSEEIVKVHTSLSPDERSVTMKLISSSISKAIGELDEEAIAFSKEEFRKPILEVLRTAPKEILADLAESLVSITSLKQRVSGELETIGGPVDVALISKGDGFIWIKRKHYFKPELNQHFGSNYFREMMDGKEAT